MSAIRLISDLESRGVRLSVTSDRVHIDAPKGAIGHQDIEHLRRHKAEIIGLMQGKGIGVLRLPLPDASRKCSVHATAIATSGGVICMFCRQPVERGTPGTGALAGADLHVDCYRKKYPNGHL